MRYCVNSNEAGPRPLVTRTEPDPQTLRYGGGSGVPSALRYIQGFMAELGDATCAPSRLRSVETIVWLMGLWDCAASP